MKRWLAVLVVLGAIAGCQSLSYYTQAIGGGLSESQDPFDADVYQAFDSLKSIQKRNAVGGTSLQSVNEQIRILKGE